MLNIAAISMVVCTLQQLYPSSNNSNTGGSNNLATATSSSAEDMLSIMAVGDSIGYNIDSKKLSNLSQIIKAPDIFIFNSEGVLIDLWTRSPNANGSLEKERIKLRCLCNFARKNGNHLTVIIITIIELILSLAILPQLIFGQI